LPRCLLHVDFRQLRLSNTRSMNLLGLTSGFVLAKSSDVNLRSRQIADELITAVVDRDLTSYDPAVLM
jgi:hypothetical protein